DSEQRPRNPFYAEHDEKNVAMKRQGSEDGIREETKTCGQEQRLSRATPKRKQSGRQGKSCHCEDNPQNGGHRRIGSHAPNDRELNDGAKKGARCPEHKEPITPRRHDPFSVGCRRKPTPVRKRGWRR